MRRWMASLPVLFIVGWFVFDWTGMEAVLVGTLLSVLAFWYEVIVKLERIEAAIEGRKSRLEE